MPALLIISLTLIPAVMAAADGVLEDPTTPPTPPVTQGRLIPLAGHTSQSDGTTMWAADDVDNKIGSYV